jgi:hypothetical protein
MLCAKDRRGAGWGVSRNGPDRGGDGRGRFAVGCDSGIGYGNGPNAVAITEACRHSDAK